MVCMNSLLSGMAIGSVIERLVWQQGQEEEEEEEEDEKEEEEDKISG